MIMRSARCAEESVYIVMPENKEVVEELVNIRRRRARSRCLAFSVSKKAEKCEKCEIGTKGAKVKLNKKIQNCKIILHGVMSALNFGFCFILHITLCSSLAPP